MTSGSFAVAYTVRDEWDLLSHAIPYYLGQGAKRIYVFWDGTSDLALQGVAVFGQVESRNCVDPGELPAIPEWVRVLDPAQKMDHRKRINTLFAAELARKEGIEWICSLDPDEIVLPDSGQEGIGTMLRSVGADHDQILVPNLELLPMPGADVGNVFESQRLFLKRQDGMAMLWRGLNAVLRHFLSPRALARLENRLYRIANRGMFPPVIRNPLDGGIIHRSLFLGYNNSKAFMRTARAQQYNFNIHRWQPVATPLGSVRRGRLLHYDLPSFSYFLKKFRQRDANMLIRAFDTRYQLGLIAREAGPGVARHFYETQICCPNAATAERLIRAGIAVHIDDVAVFFHAAAETGDPMAGDGA